MKRFLMMLLFMSVSQWVQAHDTPLFQGKFECSGKELRSEEFITTITKIEKTGETYSISGNYENNFYSGTGLYDSANQSLSAVFINAQNAKDTGIIIFRAKNINRLDATWTYLGEKRIATAVCKKLVS